MTRTSTLIATLASSMLLACPLHAAEKCFDFSGQTGGARFRAGDVVQSEILKVRFRDGLSGGAAGRPAQAEARRTGVDPSALAKGPTPERFSSLVNLQILPREPVAEIMLDVGENHADAGNGRVHIELNGAIHEVDGGLHQAHDQLLSSDAQGNARVEVEPLPNGRSGSWSQSRIRVHALSAPIETFGIGGRQFVVDHVCVTSRAP